MTDNLDALREAVLEAEAAFNKELTRSDLAMNAPVFAGLLANVAAKQTQYITRLEAALTASEQARAQAGEALKPFAAINAAYLESSHIVNPGDYDTEYWNWIVGKVSASYMRANIERAVQALATSEEMN